MLPEEGSLVIRLDSKEMHEILSGLLPKFRESKVTARKLTFEGLPYNTRRKKWLLGLPKDIWEKVPDYIVDNLEENQYAVIGDALLEKLQANTKKELVEKHDDAKLPESYMPREKFSPLMDLTSPHSDIVLLNNETGRISKFSYKSWEALLDPDSKKIKHELIRDALFKYDPYDLRPWYEDKFETMPVVTVNLYEPPKWRIEAQAEYQADERVEMPFKVKQLINHLFPNEYEKELLYDWMRETILGRNEYALVLYSAKGIGKQAFTDLLTGIVGRSNTGLAQESFFETNFNSVLKNNRFIVIDEKDIDKKAHVRLKRYLNHIQNIEEKGVDANQLMETHNNFLITLNKTEKLHLEFDDRRFLVLDTTDKDLKEIWDEREIDEFRRECVEGEGPVKEFGKWLIEYGKMSERPMSIYKGDKFWEVVKDALAPWQSIILSTILDEGHSEYTLKDLRRIYKSKSNGDTKHFPNYSKVKDFLHTYKHRNEDYLGKVIIDEDGESVLKVSKKFIKVEVDREDGLDVLEDSYHKEVEEEDVL